MFIKIKQFKYEIALLLILILASFLLLYKIDKIPYYQNGAFADEIHVFKSLTDLFDIITKPQIEYSALIFQRFVRITTFTTTAYLFFVLPTYAVFKSIIALKVTNFFFAIFTIVILYFFTSEFFNKKIALLSSFLLSINLSFINYSRIGIEDFTKIFFFVLSLFLFYRYYKTNKNNYLYFGSFILGFGLCIHPSFLYSIFSLIIVVFIYKKMPSLKKLLFCVIFFILGSFLLIAGWTVVLSEEYNFLLKNMIVTVYQHRNLDFINNLATRMNQLIMLNGEFYSWIFFAGIFYYILRKNKKMIFLILLTLTTLPISTLSYTALNPHHLLQLIAITSIITAGFILDIFSKTNKFLASIFLIIILISNFIILYYYFNQYTGSDFGYKALCNYLNEKDAKVVVSSNVLKVILPFCYKRENVIEKENAIEGLSYMLNNSNTQYILEIIENNTNISDFINKNSNITLLKTIYTSDGAEIYYVYENKAI